MTEDLPIPEGLRDTFNNGAKNIANKFGDAVRDRIQQQPERKKQGDRLQIDVIDDDGDVVNDDDGGGTKAVVPKRGKHVSNDGDGGPAEDTEMVATQQSRAAFQPKPLIPTATRPVQTRPVDLPQICFLLQIEERLVAAQWAYADVDCDFDRDQVF